MATTKSPGKKQAALNVVIPANVIKAARSRTSPATNPNKGDVIPNTTLYRLMNETAANYRTATSVASLLRHLARAEGPISTATHNIVQVANCDHLITARDSVTHEFSPEGTALANSILASMGTLYDFTEGFSTKKSIEVLKSHMLREVVLTGAIATELVLNKVRLPERMQVVPYETLELVSDGKGGYYPQQRISGQNDATSLDIATFWLSYMQQDANSVYAFSMMDSALKLIIYFEEFMEDVRRSIRNNGHTRTVVTLDLEKLTKTAPTEIRRDAVKMKAWMESVQAGVQAQLQALSPQDALVMFDLGKAENLQAGLGSKVDYTPLMGALAGMYATAMKTPPSAIGLRLEGGSQALGNIESLIFIKSCKAVQTPVEEVLSRALTLSTRLYGVDVYVEFQFKPINLRPETELQAFYTMEKQAILENLSLGFITDDYAAHLLGTGPRPASAPPLSGTMFAGGGAKSTDAEDSTNPGDSAMGRNLQPAKEVPRKAGGKSQ